MFPLFLDGLPASHPHREGQEFVMNWISRVGRQVGARDRCAGFGVIKKKSPDYRRGSRRDSSLDSGFRADIGKGTAFDALARLAAPAKRCG